MPNYNDPPTAAEQADWVDDDPSPAEIAASLSSAESDSLRLVTQYRELYGGESSPLCRLGLVLRVPGHSTCTLTDLGRAVAKELEGQNG